MKCFKNGDVISFFGKVAGAGQAGRTGADHGHAVTVSFGTGGFVLAKRIVPIGHKAFKSADADRFALDPSDAFGFALRFLRANSAANGRQRGRFRDDLIGGFKIAFSDLRNEFGNTDLDGAAVNAGHILAV